MTLIRLLFLACACKCQVMLSTVVSSGKTQKVQAKGRDWQAGERMPELKDETQQYKRHLPCMRAHSSLAFATLQFADFFKTAFNEAAAHLRPPLL